jgi:hypothetical protein
MIRMPTNDTNDEIEKQSDSQDLEGSKKKKKTTDNKSEKTTTTTKDSTTFDLTKAGNTRTGIIDILDDPDVAVWSKGIMNKTNTPADKVREPYHIKSTSMHIEYREGEEKQNHLQETVDPANKEDVAKAINLGTSLTDKATSFVQRSKKATTSSEEQKPS